MSPIRPSNLSAQLWAYQQNVYGSIFMQILSQKTDRKNKEVSQLCLFVYID